MTQTVTANPGAGIQIAPRYETPSFLQIDIPAELATLDGLYEAPPRPDPRLILHVQNAHANYDAQMKIKQLLDYLHKTYAFKTIFVEGAVETLDPEALKMFPDAERNAKLADLMAREGELNGVELFVLAEDESEGVRSTAYGEKTGDSIRRTPSAVRVEAYGIEKADLYRENYNALKTVFSAQTTVAKYLNGFEARLETLSSKVFSKDLRRVLAEWKKFEKGHREFMPYIHSLAAEAKRYLKIDLESLLAQIEWPQITRLLMLQVMEKDLRQDQALVEKDKLITFLKDKRVSPELLAAIKDFQGQRVSVLRGRSDTAPAGLEPRDLMEKLVTEAGPKGFRFQDYPEFSTYAGYLILKNELDPKGLFQEIKTVFTRILDKLAGAPDEGWRMEDGAKTLPSPQPSPTGRGQGEGVVTPSALRPPPSSLRKQLLDLYRDEELVRKLLNLELPRKEWQDALARKEMLEPNVLVGRLKKLQKTDGGWRMEDGAKTLLSPQPSPAGRGQGEGVVTPSDLHHPSSAPAPQGAAFRAEVVAVQAAAFGFYEAARKREDVFYEKIDAVMTQGAVSKAVLVTGGFHTDGITDLLREHEISYGILTPRLTKKSNDKLYRDNMLQNHPSMFDLATLELQSLLQDIKTLMAQGVIIGSLSSHYADRFFKILQDNPQQLEATLEFFNRYLAGRFGHSLEILKNGKEFVLTSGAFVVKGQAYAVHFAPTSDGNYSATAKKIASPEKPGSLSEPGSDAGAAAGQKVRAESRANPRLVSFHGSPNNFFSFDPDKIGKKANEYGWGVYTAFFRAIADGHRGSRNRGDIDDAVLDSLTENVEGSIRGNVKNILKDIFSRSKNREDWEKEANFRLFGSTSRMNNLVRENNSIWKAEIAREERIVRIDQAIVDVIKNTDFDQVGSAMGEGYVYRTEHLAPTSSYMVWEANIADQSPEVKASLLNAGILKKKQDGSGEDVVLLKYDSGRGARFVDPKNVTGGEVYNDITAQQSKDPGLTDDLNVLRIRKAASMFFKRFGISGNKLPKAYVTFDPRDLKITAVSVGGRPFQSQWGDATAEKASEAFDPEAVRKAIEDVLKNDDLTPERLLEELSRIPRLKALYAKPAKPGAGYSLYWHTLTVMEQFEQYFYGDRFPSEYRNRFLLMLALHDIGKPETGKDKDQYAPTEQVLGEVLPWLPVSESDANLLKALILGDASSRDPLGRYIQFRNDPVRKISVRDAAGMIEKSREMSAIPMPDFFRLLTVYYQVDAGSYTRDAGLVDYSDIDSIFFTSANSGEKGFDDKKNRMAFAPGVTTYFDALETAVMSPSHAGVPTPAEAPPGRIAGKTVWGVSPEAERKPPAWMGWLSRVVPKKVSQESRSEVRQEVRAEFRADLPSPERRITGLINVGQLRNGDSHSLNVENEDPVFYEFIEQVSYDKASGLYKLRWLNLMTGEQEVLAYAPERAINDTKVISEPGFPGFDAIDAVVAGVNWRQYTNRLYKSLESENPAAVSESEKWRLYLRPASSGDREALIRIVKAAALKFDKAMELKYLAQDEFELRKDAPDATKFVVNFASRDDLMSFFDLLKGAEVYEQIVGFGETPFSTQLDSLASYAQGHVAERQKAASTAREEKRRDESPEIFTETRSRSAETQSEADLKDKAAEAAQDAVIILRSRTDLPDLDLQAYAAQLESVYREQFSRVTDLIKQNRISDEAGARIQQAFDAGFIAHQARFIVDTRVQPGGELAGESPLRKRFMADGTTPYIVHLVGVFENMAVRMRMTGRQDSDLLVAAFLHDALEDTSLTAGEIEAGFGSGVLGIVRSLTKNAESAAYYENLLLADAWKVKFADDLMNLSGGEMYDREKSRAYAASKARFFVPVLVRGMDGKGPEWAGLSQRFMLFWNGLQVWLNNGGEFPAAELAGVRLSDASLDFDTARVSLEPDQRAETPSAGTVSPAVSGKAAGVRSESRNADLQIGGKTIRVNGDILNDALWERFKRNAPQVLPASVETIGYILEYSDSAIWMPTASKGSVFFDSSSAVGDLVRGQGLRVGEDHENDNLSSQRRQKFNKVYKDYWSGKLALWVSSMRWGQDDWTGSSQTTAVFFVKNGKTQIVVLERASGDPVSQIIDDGQVTVRSLAEPISVTEITPAKPAAKKESAAEEKKKTPVPIKPAAEPISLPGGQTLYSTEGMNPASKAALFKELRGVFQDEMAGLSYAINYLDLESYPKAEALYIKINNKVAGFLVYENSRLLIQVTRSKMEGRHIGTSLALFWLKRLQENDPKGIATSTILTGSEYDASQEDSRDERGTGYGLWRGLERLTGNHGFVTERIDRKEPFFEPGEPIFGQEEKEIDSIRAGNKRYSEVAIDLKGLPVDAWIAKFVLRSARVSPESGRRAKTRAEIRSGVRLPSGLRGKWFAPYLLAIALSVAATSANARDFFRVRLGGIGSVDAVLVANEGSLSEAGEGWVGAGLSFGGARDAAAPGFPEEVLDAAIKGLLSDMERAGGTGLGSEEVAPVSIEAPTDGLPILQVPVGPVSAEPVITNEVLSAEGQTNNVVPPIVIDRSSETNILDNVGGVTPTPASDAVPADQLRDGVRPVSENVYGPVIRAPGPRAPKTGLPTLPPAKRDPLGLGDQREPIEQPTSPYSSVDLVREQKAILEPKVERLQVEQMVLNSVLKKNEIALAGLDEQLQAANAASDSTAAALLNARKAELLALRADHAGRLALVTRLIEWGQFLLIDLDNYGIFTRARGLDGRQAEGEFIKERLGAVSAYPDWTEFFQDFLDSMIVPAMPDAGLPGVREKKDFIAAHDIDTSWLFPEAWVPPMDNAVPSVPEPTERGRVLDWLEEEKMFLEVKLGDIGRKLDVQKRAYADALPDGSSNNAPEHAQKIADLMAKKGVLEQHLAAVQKAIDQGPSYTGMLLNYVNATGKAGAPGAYQTPRQAGDAKFAQYVLYSNGMHYAPAAETSAARSEARVTRDEQITGMLDSLMETPERVSNFTSVLSRIVQGWTSKGVTDLAQIRQELDREIVHLMHFVIPVEAVVQKDWRGGIRIFGLPLKRWLQPADAGKAEKIRGFFKDPHNRESILRLSRQRMLETLARLDQPEEREAMAQWLTVRLAELKEEAKGGPYSYLLILEAEDYLDEKFSCPIAKDFSFIVFVKEKTGWGATPNVSKENPLLPVVIAGEKVGEVRWAKGNVIMEDSTFEHRHIEALIAATLEYYRQRAGFQQGAEKEAVSKRAAARSEARAKRRVWIKTMVRTALILVPILFIAQATVAAYWGKEASRMYDPKDYNVMIVAGAEDIEGLAKAGAIYVSNANAFKKVNGKNVAVGWVRSGGKDLNPYNPNTRGLGMAKGVLMKRKSGEFMIRPAEELDPSKLSPEEWPDGFQAGPMVITDGVINPKLEEWYSGMLEGRMVILGADLQGNFHTLDLFGPDVFGQLGLTQSNFMRVVGQWKKDKDIVYAFFPDGGNTGIRRTLKTPEVALMAVPKATKGNDRLLVVQNTIGAGATAGAAGRKEVRAETRSEQRVASAAPSVPVVPSAVDADGAVKLAMEAELARNITAEMALQMKREMLAAQAASKQKAAAPVEVAPAKEFDAAAYLKSLSSAERKTLEMKMADVRLRVSENIPDAVIVVAILVGGILDLRAAGNMEEAGTQMMLLAATIGGNAIVALKAAFAKSFPNSELPAGDAAGLVIDILEGMPSAAKVEAIKGMLALNENQHYGLIVPKNMSAQKVQEEILAWGDLNVVKNIRTRIHVTALTVRGVKYSVKKVMPDLGKAKINSVVITGLLKDLSEVDTDLLGTDLKATNLIERDGIPAELDAVAGTVMSVKRSQELVLGGEKFSEATQNAIKQPKGSKLYKFSLTGLQAVAKSLGAQLQGLISLSQSA
jgi:hypothetical protein